MRPPGAAAPTGAAVALTRLVGPVALVAALATGCGGSSSGSSYAALSTTQATQALLVAGDLPGTFTAVKASTQDDQQAGCLAATTKLDAVPAAVDERSAFVSRAGQGVSGALSQVRSDPDAAALSKAFATFRSSVAGCKDVKQATASSSFDLAITTDTGTGSGTSPVHLEAKGTLASDGRSFDYHVAFAVSLVGHSIVIVAAYDLGTVAKPLVPDLSRLDDLVVHRVEKLAT